MSQPVVIFAPNVGGGGGLVLLRDMLRVAWPGASGRLTAILDRRGRLQLGELDPAIDIHWVDSNVKGRWHAEKLLSRLAGREALILCFHNLPPILAKRGQVFCYVQNANLVGIIPKSHLSGWLRVRYAIERSIARRFRHRVARYIVQTPTMATALGEWYGPGAPPIDILPFVGTEQAIAGQSDSEQGASNVEPTWGDRVAPLRRWDFIYVSDGSFHKNHRRLFAAWRLLAEQGIRPSLAVTLHPERDKALREQVRVLAAEGLNIEDLGQLPHIEVLEAYRRSQAFIFPSYAESFGIPLMEASAVGLPVLAPELDYVRDVCEPFTTFDATSPRSMARAVRRFLGYPADRVAPLGPEAFVAALCNLDSRKADWHFAE